MLKRSVSRRWFVNTAGLVLVIMVIFITILVVTTRSYAYDNISSILRGRADEMLNVLATTNSGGYKSPNEFASLTRGYIENFPDKNSMEIHAIDRNGKVFVTSTGFAPNPAQEMKDYKQALEKSDNIGHWVGVLDTGEQVMATTRIVRDSGGSVIGAVRYIVSMEKVEEQLVRITFVLIGVGLIIMLFIVAVGLYFVRSIVSPVQAVTATARQIAQGDFDVRIKKNKDDEIGRLCDSVNDMAAQLSKTEIMKNDFISSVSHELRTPLTSIQGWAETLQSENGSETMVKGMQVIGREAQRLSGIVEELLDFSRLQSGRMKVMFKKTDILSELDEAVYMFTNRAEKEGKILNYEERLSLSSVYADADKLKQVFVNIIDNALKYTKTGGEVTISAGESEGRVVIMIADTGVGIPKEDLSKVKEKFYKANQLVRGSGIGLAVADEIMKIHSGHLFIESEEGVGTAVTVMLPTVQLVSSNTNINLSLELKQFLGRTEEVAKLEQDREFI